MSESNRIGPRSAASKVRVGSESAIPASGVASLDFAPGRMVAGKYLVERTIGEGGLGAVVKARHVQLDQDVAIKHIRPSELSRPDVVERFLREARLAAKIKNEHAVKVQDVDMLESGVPYMVMEFLEGRDLGQLLMPSPLPIDQAIDCLLQACEALAEAHAIGIVHRDLKPANMFLTPRPGGASLLKVLDFGISRLASDRGARVTRIDERIGTPEYMSPEQLEAVTDVDARADIWSLGVTLYELVTGKMPFPEEGLPQLCVAILTKAPVPMSAVNPDATPALEAVVARCLEKDRDRRYQNVAELAQDLAAIWEGESPSRVQQIARVTRESGARVAPPTPFPGSIDVAQVTGALAIARATTSPAPAVAIPARPAAPAPPAAPASPPETRTIDADAPDWVATAAQSMDDQVTAVLRDASGATIDELQFLSIDEAYDYASSQGPTVVRCDIYDQLEDVRGRLRVTYVKSAETGHWVPLLT
jgi:serine/threonine-protein kinase